MRKKGAYNGIKVLIFEAGGRQVLPICKGFYDIGCCVSTYCFQKLDTGNLTKYADNHILYSKVKQKDESFYDCGARLIREGNYDLVVPLGDKSATYLSQRKLELEKHSHIAVNDWETFQFAINKFKTMNVCKNNNIPAPVTLESDNPIGEIDDGVVSFPVVVKPITAVGSIGFSIINNRETLEKYLNNYNNENGPLLIQEYIKQGNEPQIRVDLFRTKCGEFKAAIVSKVTRWYPLDGGSGIFVTSIHDDVIIKNCERLLDVINWNGYANIDMVIDEKTRQAKVLEINGRTGASIKQDFVAGINISQLILENELGYDVTDMLEYPDGKSVSCLLPDLLWFIKSPNRFSTKPSWFNRFGVKDTIFSWDDPLPSIGFLITSVKSFKSAQQKRKRVN